jgi:hypothetical protein
MLKSTPKPSLDEAGDELGLKGHGEYTESERKK